MNGQAAGPAEKTATHGNVPSQYHPIFICYRQIDGRRFATWIYDALKNQLEAKAKTTPIYFDLTAPSTGDWTSVHRPALEQACAMVVICTPGLFPDQGKLDWVHRELDWWLKHREVPPILIETTGEGSRWIPAKVKKRWPNLQRINLAPDLWQHTPPEEQQQNRLRVTGQILTGIDDSKLEIIKEDLARAKRNTRILGSLAFALLLLVGIVVGLAWFARQQRRVAESRALAAESQLMLSRDRGLALDFGLQGWSKAKTLQANESIARSFAQLTLKITGPSSILSAFLSADGQRITTVQDEGGVIVWDAITGKRLFSLGGTLLAHSKDGQRILSETGKNTITVFDAADGLSLASLSTEADPLYGSFSPDGNLVLIVEWTTLEIYRVSDRKQIFNAHRQTAYHSARFFPDGDRLLTAEFDSLKIWNVWTGTLIRTFPNNHMPGVTTLSPDGKILLTEVERERYSAPSAVQLWKVDDGEPLMSLETGNSLTQSAAFSFDGKKVVTVNQDHAVRIWTIADRSSIEIGEHLYDVRSAIFSGDSHLLLTTNSDNVSRIWDASNGRMLAAIEGTASIFGPESYRILSFTADYVGIWSLVAGRLLTKIDHAGLMGRAEISPDGRQIITSDAGNGASVWSVETGRRQFALTTPHTVLRASFAPDGRTIITADGNVANIWQTSTGRLSASLQSHTQQLRDAQFSADGKQVVTAGSDKTGKVWDVSTGKLLVTLQGHLDVINSASFSADGSKVVTASNDGTARVWNALNGDVLAVLRDGTAIAYAAFLPRGQVITLDADNKANLWDSANNRRIATLSPVGARINLFLPFSTDFPIQHLMAISPDGARIAAISRKILQVWKADTGELLLSQSIHDIGECVTFSPDGGFILTGGMNSNGGEPQSNGRIWDARNFELIATLPGTYGTSACATMALQGHRILLSDGLSGFRVYELITLSDLTALLKN